VTGVLGRCLTPYFFNLKYVSVNVSFICEIVLRKKKELLNLNGNISYPFERGHDL
jgi:hypothetical protein